jgi:hypothetical protein
MAVVDLLVLRCILGKEPGGDRLVSHILGVSPSVRDEDIPGAVLVGVFPSWRLLSFQR